MRLFNSLTKQLESFTPVNSSELSIYSCGPTVYERAHIGNLASFIYADTLRRALAHSFPDATIKHVMNLTDVDDKTIKRSSEEFPDLDPMKALQKLTKRYEDLFMKDLEAVGVDVKSITFVRATDFIPKMQSLIQSLVSAGIGYLTDDGVYFSIAKYKAADKTYGQLVSITAESTGAARVNNDEYDKDNVHDFALWKKQKPGEPAWEFEIDGQDLRGRPGWHIECSAMSVSELGQPFDVHTGGIDLKFPHHENEIAQSTAIGNEKTMATFFFHSEHLLVDGQKMSKSLHNFYTLDDLEQKGFGPLAFRLLVLQAHYRGQAHFSWENIEAAQNRLHNLYAWADLVYQSNVAPGILDASVAKDYEQEISDDLKVASLFLPIEAHAEMAPEAGLLQSIEKLLGLGLASRLNITEEQTALIQSRETARKEQDWTKSDELRDQLQKQGIGINDTPQGTIWYRL